MRSGREAPSEQASDHLTKPGGAASRHRHPGMHSGDRVKKEPDSTSEW